MAGQQTSAPARAWPVTLVWALLVAASIAGSLLADSVAVARIAESATVLLAAGKIALVICHYMELSWRHTPLAPLLAVWLSAVTVLLLATCWSL